ncbi:MAG TPA: 2-oxoacid:acceptor oxidoreductase family protein [Polyangiaceae bacterium]|jgi:2-oxoglutarate ferredoxin oxidoreductase subunit gamma|nr:MAG: NADH-dependent phenylglyoxylate dehydrogenase subunit gamma [Deltaproteobacteria bacterium ADurb.Bin207]HNS98916.1 2-oxoacid:acceptor oxidoreductase family protein [Polyangiaceae bacterium]HNZ24880.1 2-oxoacid:acceptor oxidoreductase family protein [Polyangiaceae bacterium]HOD24588.1 2-oxoacid:acceptor oxidoreductase family protein [Polyangiaceae bacterium]HOE50223.1 2-oxoacid:acceptor oxidoreductase family protein [Polyangiaceae bacterium]
MTTTEIKFGGLGGQGVILAGIITGKAAALFDNKEATLTQAFGPEARGSACSAQVVVSDTPILYPYVTRPRVLVSMSQDAYTKFSPQIAQGGMLLIEQDMVKPDPIPNEAKVFGVPATRIAEELGRRMILNIVMVGFFTSITKLVSVDAMRKAVEDSVPRGTTDLNLKAFDRGFQWGEKLIH